MSAAHDLRLGFIWFYQGWLLLRTSLGRLLMIFMLYSGFIFFISLIPIVGPIVNIIILPLFSVIFMQACRSDAGTASVPLAAFDIKNINQPRALVRLGVLYLIAFVLAMLPGIYFYGETFYQTIHIALENPTSQSLEAGLEPLFNATISGMLVLALCLAPVFAAFWFAPNLVSWHAMPIKKALFFSLMVWYKRPLAWLSYLAALIFLSTLLPSLFLSIGAAVLPLPLLSLLVVFYYFFLYLLLYCSLYPCYRFFFEAVDDTPIGTRDYDTSN